MALLPVFFVKLNEGYSLRNVITAIHKEVDDLDIVFSENEIRCCFTNKNDYALFDIKISTKKIGDYKFNPPFTDDDEQSDEDYDEDEDGEDERRDRYFSVQFDAMELLTGFKSIGKRNGVDFFMREDDLAMCVRATENGQVSLSKGAGYVLAKVNHSPVPMPPSCGDEKGQTPLVRIGVKELANAFTNICSSRSSYVEFHYYPEGLHIKGIRSSGILAWNGKFGKVPDAATTNSNDEDDSDIEIDDPFDISTMKIIRPQSNSPVKVVIVSGKDDQTGVIKTPVSTIRNLSKLNNIAPTPTSSMVRIYKSKNEPLKMVIPLGTYGKFTICLRDARI